ncbi:MAG: hypothetical protein GXY17_09050 [Clostridiaceae bacterium]|nr:hypothetical protein [Clostridiaceae bacterium]
MDLDCLYFEVKENIDRVCFDDLWRGFQPFKFALYDDYKCFYNGSYIDKPKEFVANTSVFYEGQHIAIWHVMEPMDPIILATKIIHEMFHAFQNIRGESRFPKELEALCEYQYDEVNLSLKYEENRTLLLLLENFCHEAYLEFLSYRAFRRKKYPYEFRYEASVEEIEGAAQYVEFNALNQLSEELFAESIVQLKERILVAEDVFPIRVRCYDVGTLFFQVLKNNNLLDFEENSDVLTADRTLSGVHDHSIEIKLNPDIIKGIDRYRINTSQMIRRGIEEGILLEEGELELLGLNVYDARFFEGNLLSTHFVFYRKDGQEKVQYGDFLIRLDDQKKVIKILKIKI